MTPDVQIRKMARRAAYRFGRDDKEELAKDLEMAGWIGYLSSGDNLMRAKDEIRDAWVIWRFGIHRRVRSQIVERVEPIQIDNYDVPSDRPTVEDLVSTKELVDKLPECQGVLSAMLMNGSPQLDGMTNVLGLTHAQIRNRKRKIRNELRRIL